MYDYFIHSLFKHTILLQAGMINVVIQQALPTITVTVEWTDLRVSASQLHYVDKFVALV